jgi:hypothetical protein
MSKRKLTYEYIRFTPGEFRLIYDFLHAAVSETEYPFDGWKLSAAERRCAKRLYKRVKAPDADYSAGS